MPTPPKLQPALYGGLLIGVLWALPPLSLCCCLWGVGGGTIAVYLMQQNHPHPITAADGALVGLLAGIFGAIVGVLLSIPVNMILGPFLQRTIQAFILNSPDVPSDSKAMIENVLARNNSGPTVVGTMFSMAIGMVAGAIFGMLGGLLGVALFKKKDLPPPGTVEILPPA